MRREEKRRNQEEGNTFTGIWNRVGYGLDRLDIAYTSIVWNQIEGIGQIVSGVGTHGVHLAE